MSKETQSRLYLAAFAAVAIVTAATCWHLQQGIEQQDAEEQQAYSRD